MICIHSSDLDSPSGAIQTDLLIIASNRKLLSGGKSTFVLWLPVHCPYFCVGIVRSDTSTLSNIPELDGGVCATVVSVE